ncbi:MAG TPA: efflux RND transporter periplasmic adaptor subunit [Gemmataceae bacterium]|jgi:RND family efflux transporter MFP subunit|nr:efflux RND transporter periplasmic adaptor subunit [Gemmataceae bacterium]
MIRRNAWIPGKWQWLCILCGALCAGCERGQAQLPPPPQTPEVKVSLPVTRQVTDYEDFPGRLDAVNAVEVRARVSGYLDKMHFTEGADVKKGDVLFEIDPRPYKAELARAEGNVAQSEGHLKRLEADYQRALTLYPKGAMGREDFDRTTGDRTEAVGALAVSRAARDMARLNMEFTKVLASQNGRISRRMIDPGNMVKADETPLTTIVSLDPIYAYFDLDERTTLRLQRLFRQDKIKWATDAGLPVLLGLADEDAFPRQGTINFADNRVDADTGTWRLRGLFKNADHALSPGMFVRIRLPVGTPYQATLISEQAISSDQGRKYVYVVDKSDKVESRPIKIGRLHDGLRVITSGLKTDDRVVVSGLQRVRPGMEVNPGDDPVPMPIVSNEDEPASAAGSSGRGAKGQNHEVQNRPSGGK